MQRQRETHGPTPTTEGRLTLHDWIEEHLRTSSRLSERTRADQRRIWLTYSTPQLRATPLRDVTTALLDAFVTDLRTRKSTRTGEVLSARTVALVFNVIRAALKSKLGSMGPLKPGGIVFPYWHGGPARDRHGGHERRRRRCGPGGERHGAAEE